MRSWLVLLPLCACASGGDKGAEPSYELCNGLDDDLDGAIDEDYSDMDHDGIADCVDDECTIALPEAGVVDVSEACTGTEFSGVEDAWNIDPEWSYSDPGGGVIVMPAVGNMTDDNGDGVIDFNDTPDVAVATYSNTLILVDGGTGELIWELEGYYAYAGVVIADVDADGVNEVVALDGSYQVVALDGDGEAEWTADAYAFTQFYPQPIVADLDEDGVPEIVFDQLVLNGEDGSVAVELETPTSPYNTPVAADLDQDGTMEIILGENVYGYDGELLWQGTISTYGNFSAVVDTDGDDEAEILMVTDSSAFLYEDDGDLITEFDLDILQAGVPCAADFDGDGEVEFGIPASTVLYMVEADGEEVWQATIDDASGLAGCSAFDFDADGDYEMMFADQGDFFIFDGPSGELLYNDSDHASGTVWEYPVIADIDADGSAEVVVASNGGGAGGLRSYGQVSNLWPPAGPGWPTHDYGGTNVTADGAVVTNPEPSWKAYNLFRARTPADDIASADLIVELVDFCVTACPTGEMVVGFQVSNQGPVDAEAGVPVTLYAISGSDTYAVQTITLTDPIPSGASVAGGQFTTVPSYFGPEGFVIRVDDDGSGGTTTRDCDRSNNDVSYDAPVCGTY